jgi:HAMP domain-containing protein
MSLVFTATVLTALLVTWVSVQSIHGFLSEQIEEKFPAILESRKEKLNVWYAQVRLDIDTFARSATVEKNLAALGSSRKRAAQAREELEKYLSYVLEHFEQYKALFVLDTRGKTLLWVGEKHDVTPELRRELAQRAESYVSDALTVEGALLQLASAPVRRGGESRLGSLHALVDLEALEKLVVMEDVGPRGEVFLVRHDGTYLTSTPTRRAGGTFSRALPEPGSRPTIQEYSTRIGEGVVGAAIHFERFNWAIVIEEPYTVAFEPIFGVIWRVLVLNLGIVVLFGLIALRIAISVIRPIRALSTGARRVANGEAGIAIPEPSSDDEIALLTRTFNQMTERLRQHQVELHRKNDELELLSVTDDLTGLYNHRYFQEQLQLEVERSCQPGRALALLLIDIDDFKQQNELYGHAAGGRGERDRREDPPRALQRHDPHRHGVRSVGAQRDGLDRRGDLRGRREGVPQRRRPRAPPGQGARKGLRPHELELRRLAAATR